MAHTSYVASRDTPAEGPTRTLHGTATHTCPAQQERIRTTKNIYHQLFPQIEGTFDLMLMYKKAPIFTDRVAARYYGRH